MKRSGMLRHLVWLVSFIVFLAGPQRGLLALADHQWSGTWYHHDVVRGMTI